MVNVSFDVRKGEENSFRRRKRKWEKHDHKTHFKTNINAKMEEIFYQGMDSYNFTPNEIQ